MRACFLILILYIFCSCSTYKKYEYSGPLICKCDGDYDGDGISDCWDKCGDTPGGADADMHGCPKDTDGDGVADYKDYQLITPTECQPVDSLGVGLCPCPCENKFGIVCDFRFKEEWVGFSFLSFRLDSTGKKTIERFANQMKSNPNFPIKITGFTDNNSESNVQASWSRVYEVRKYLINKLGIDADRIFMYPGSLGRPYLVKLTGLSGDDYKSLRPGVIPPFFPGFIDETNKRILNWDK